MSDIIDELEYLASEYESGDHVDISAFNYFQLALDEITQLQVKVYRLESRGIEDMQHHIEELETDAINNEIGTVTYRGHGSQTTWSWSPYRRISRVKKRIRSSS